MSVEFDKPIDDVAAALQLRSLRERLRIGSEIPDPWQGDESLGLGPSDLRALRERWAEGFDWTAIAARINDLPWTVVKAGPHTLRVVHQRASDQSAPVVLLLHGWPDSVLRFEKLLPLLGEMHVVVPALPGFPFATPISGPVSVNDIADNVAAVMAELGYTSYTVSGGDIGGDVAEILAATYPETVASLHLTNVSARHVFALDPARLDTEAAEYLPQAMAWNRANGGYIAEQSSRPRTLLSALGDSPLGLAAWIVEKVQAWSDDASASFTADDLLTWVSAYWFTGAIGTSFSTYVLPATIPARSAVPTVFSAFAADIKPAPRSYVETFVNVRNYITHDVGGHFAAWEQPERYAADLCAAVAYQLR